MNSAYKNNDDSIKVVVMDGKTVTTQYISSKFERLWHSQFKQAPRMAEFKAWVVKREVIETLRLLEDVVSIARIKDEREFPILCEAIVDIKKKYGITEEDLHERDLKIVHRK